ncbi:MAG: hypothetical protein HKN79_08115 [Flavobacteriales bacterium]|nr:hypothetical protein [Flavobacteriales bacterium]
MNPVQSRLRSEPFSTVFEIAARTFKPITIGYLLYTLVSLIFILPLLFIVMDIDPAVYMDMVSISDPIQRQQAAQEMISGMNMEFDPMMILSMMVIVCGFLLVGSWFYNLCFIAIEAYIRDRSLSLGELIKKSFNANVFWLVLASLLISLIGFSASILVSLFSAVGGGTAVLLVLVGFVLMGGLMMRLMLVFPAIVHGNMSVGSAIAHSWKTIHFARGMKYFGVSILVFISLVVLLFVLGMIQAAMMMIPVVGVVLYILLSLAMGGFMSAWTTAVVSGIYFRHSDSIEDTGRMDLEDHLIA